MLAPIALGDIELYNVLEVRNLSLLDIGAFIGDSVVYFASRGARKIYAYEPLYHELVRLNVKLNGIDDKVVVYAKGIHYKGGIMCVKANHGSSGLKVGSTCFEVEPLSGVLKAIKPDVVKMDCEGCEYSLLLVPCNVLVTIQEWLIEVHGAEPLLVEKMVECGFDAERVHGDTLLSLWVFRRRS